MAASSSSESVSNRSECLSRETLRTRARGRGRATRPTDPAERQRENREPPQETDTGERLGKRLSRMRCLAPQRTSEMRASETRHGRVASLSLSLSLGVSLSVRATLTTRERDAVVARHSPRSVFWPATDKSIVSLCKLEYRRSRVFPVSPIWSRSRRVLKTAAETAYASRLSALEITARLETSLQPLCQSSIRTAFTRFCLDAASCGGPATTGRAQPRSRRAPTARPRAGPVSFLCLLCSAPSPHEFFDDESGRHSSLLGQRRSTVGPRWRETHGGTQVETRRFRTNETSGSSRLVSPLTSTATRPRGAGDAGVVVVAALLTRSRVALQRVRM